MAKSSGEVDLSRKVRPSAAKKAVQAAFSKNISVMMWGPPGIGKSDLIRQIGLEEERQVVDIRLLLMETVDLRGIPYYDPKTGKQEWGHPTELPSDPESKAIIFFDEINAAPPQTQAAAYQLILDRKCGTYVLPKGCSIIAAGNRESDKGVTYKMPSPLANRFIHLEMTVNIEDWEDWAINNHVEPSVVSYLKYAPSKLAPGFDKQSASRAFPTPRSWSYVSKIVSIDGLTNSLMLDLAAGAVGEGPANEYMTHRSLTSKLPNPRDIVAGKMKDYVFKDSSGNAMSLQYNTTVELLYLLKDLFDASKKNKEEHKKFLEATNHALRFCLDTMEDEMLTMMVRRCLVNSITILDQSIPAFKEVMKKIGPMIRQIGLSTTF